MNSTLLIVGVVPTAVRVPAYIYIQSVEPVQCKAPTLPLCAFGCHGGSVQYSALFSLFGAAVIPALENSHRVKIKFPSS